MSPRGQAQLCIKCNRKARQGSYCIGHNADAAVRLAVLRLGVLEGPTVGPRRALEDALHLVATADVGTLALDAVCGAHYYLFGWRPHEGAHVALLDEAQADAYLGALEALREFYVSRFVRTRPVRRVPL